MLVIKLLSFLLHFCDVAIYIQKFWSKFRNRFQCQSRFFKSIPVLYGYRCDQTQFKSSTSSSRISLQILHDLQLGTLHRICQKLHLQYIFVCAIKFQRYQFNVLQVLWNYGYESGDSERSWTDSCALTKDSVHAGIDMIQRQMCTLFLDSFLIGYLSYPCCRITKFTFIPKCCSASGFEVCRVAIS